VLYEWLLSENLFVFRWKIQNGRHCWAVVIQDPIESVSLTFTAWVQARRLVVSDKKNIFIYSQRVLCKTMSCNGLQLKISTTRTQIKTLMGPFSENEYVYACADISRLQTS
jgi:hypothetical protein